MSNPLSADGPVPPGPQGRRLPAGQRRQEILAVARRLFAERGYDATTTREVAAAAGVSDALIYRHFASKDALLRALIDDGIERFSTLGPPPSVDLRQVPLRALLAGLGRSFVAALDEQLDLVVLLVSQRHLLDTDTRFIRFIDSAAATLGVVIDQQYPAPPTGQPGGDGASAGPSRGYLLARGYMGSLVAAVLLQNHLGLRELRQVDLAAYQDCLAATLVAGLEANPSS